MANKTEGLRFAPLIRVSTESQAAKGESLRTQTAQIEQYVKSLKGKIPKRCRKYSGQEHATPNQERAKLETLLADSSKNLFDAVIVCDASRWSRDNLKSKTGLEALRKNAIRFFVGTMEYDLFNPEHSFILGMSAEVGELQARQQSLKSITNRIARAKRGLPSSGSLPHGRTFDRKTEAWGIDEEKAEAIRQAASRYLGGEGIVAIAATLGMTSVGLWKVLTHRSGDRWELRFRAKDLNIDETIEIEIPRLLDEHTIAAIHERARANKTYKHGEIKHRYLLSRMIFCAKCGGTLSGQADVRSGKRYYRHPRYRVEGCALKKWVPASLMENSVLIHLLQTFGDVERLQRAVERATPDMAKIEKLADEQNSLSKELKKVSGQKDNIVKAVGKGTLSEGEVKAEMYILRAREGHIQSRLATIEEQLEGVPDPARVKRLSKFGLAVFKNATRQQPQMVFKKPYEWKRNLVEHAFGGLDSKRQRLGVYVEGTGDPDQPWNFEIRGVLESTLLGLPLDDTYLEDAFRLDPEFDDIEAELKEIKSKVGSFTPSSPSSSPAGLATQSPVGSPIHPHTTY
jgi:DNA invertase Pin-like site-specific DNA recombinase